MNGVSLIQRGREDSDGEHESRKLRNEPEEPEGVRHAMARVLGIVIASSVFVSVAGALSQAQAGPCSDDTSTYEQSETWQGNSANGTLVSRNRLFWTVWYSQNPDAPCWKGRIQDDDQYLTGPDCMEMAWDWSVDDGHMDARVFITCDEGTWHDHRKSERGDGEEGEWYNINGMQSIGSCTRHGSKYGDRKNCTVIRDGGFFNRLAERPAGSYDAYDPDFHVWDRSGDLSIYDEGTCQFGC